jgi:hypothetical protein
LFKVCGGQKGGNNVFDEHEVTDYVAVFIHGNNLPRSPKPAKKAYDAGVRISERLTRTIDVLQPQHA